MQLRSKIENFQLDDPTAEWPMTRRLAWDKGWDQLYTDRVSQEYKKFLYLAAAHGPVCPSEDVDEMWHMHLCYTRSYWDELCGQVLGGPLHHGPTRGGQKESNVYNSLYTETLAKYQTVYGHKPPPDIWPEANVRFKARAPLNTRTHWCLPKDKVSKKAKGIAAGITLLGLAACSDVAASGWIIIGTLLSAGVLVIGWALLGSHGEARQNKKTDDKSGSGDGGCSGFVGTSGASAESSSDCGDGGSGCGGGGGCGGCGS